MKNYIYLILIFTSIILTTSCDDKISSLENLNTEPNLEYFSRSTVRWTNSNDVIRDSAKVYNKQNNANYSVSLRAKDINNNFQNITISESKNGGLFFINDDLFEDMKTVEIDSFSLAFRYYSTEVRSFKVISEDDFGKSKEATFEISFIDNILPNSVLEIRQINDISLNEYILDGTLSQDGDYNLEDHSFGIHKINNEPAPKEQSISFDNAKKKVKDMVYNSVESRSVSDVPLGTFLSGGVDSSIVSLCLSQSTGKKIDTFSIGFKKTSYDESDKARTVAKMIDSNHHEFIIDEDDLKNSIHNILVNFDEPFSDTASLPTHLVSQKTKEYVTVALTGDGGDEVFGGYNKYYMGKMNRRYTGIIPSGLHKVIQKSANKFLTTPDDRRGKRFKINKFLNAVDYNGQFYWDIISLANSGSRKNRF